MYVFIRFRLSIASRQDVLQIQDDFETTSGPIFSVDTAAVNAGDPFGNRQPEAYSSRLAVARVGHPIERTENVGQLRIGHARPTI